MRSLEDKILEPPSVTEQENDEDLWQAEANEYLDELESGDRSEDLAVPVSKRVSVSTGRCFDLFSERESGPKAGKKAVLADAKWSKKMERNLFETNRLKGLQAYRNFAYGTELNDEDIPSYSLAYENQMKKHHKQLTSENHNDEADEDLFHRISSFQGEDDVHQIVENMKESTGKKKEISDSEFDEDDETFFQQLRASRIAEFRRKNLLPVYGKLIDIEEATDMVDKVDSCPKDAIVLVLLYEDFIPACRNWISVFKQLAIDYRHTMFLSMRTSLTTDYWDPISLPALVAYRGGETLQSFVCLHRSKELGGSGLGISPCVSDVESWLVEVGLIS